MVEAAAIRCKAGMMVRSKSACTVLVAATVFLTVAGPLPLCLPVRTSGWFLLVRLTLCVVLRSPGLVLLRFRLRFLPAPGLLLRFRLRFLPAPGLLLFWFGRLRFLLFRGFALLRLFFGFSCFFVLLLLSVRGSKDPEKKNQNSRTDKPDCFHRCSPHHDDYMRHSLLAFWAFEIGDDESRIRTSELRFSLTAITCGDVNAWAGLIIGVV